MKTQAQQKALRAYFDSIELPIDLEKTIKAIEAALIDAALIKAKNNKTHAAHLLGIKRTTLVMKLQRSA